MNLLSLPQMVEKLEELTFVPNRDGAIRPGTTLAREAVADLIVARPERALRRALDAMAKDARWWDLAVEIGQWC
ncbi:hypothetical protein LCGC14_2309540 [marine sediment metagenome]|uniref:Uncharacterized protein n=1 Tax=marine sediment metagenome TaxID=412755 RepID=A0A0F9CL22_9ZZZZ